jgi:hypothetical protein
MRYSRSRSSSDIPVAPAWMLLPSQRSRPIERCTHRAGTESSQGSPPPSRPRAAPCGTSPPDASARSGSLALRTAVAVADCLLQWGCGAEPGLVRRRAGRAARAGRRLVPALSTIRPRCRGDPEQRLGLAEEWDAPVDARDQQVGGSELRRDAVGLPVVRVVEPAASQRPGPAGRKSHRMVRPHSRRWRSAGSGLFLSQFSRP